MLKGQTAMEYTLLITATVVLVSAVAYLIKTNVMAA
ncbi:Uncharacterised protein [Candidatus Norongarragalina meridionalis]|nr:Uncharacterised protein [Candidatus Norongarragalina meridionalis]